MKTQTLKATSRRRQTVLPKRSSVSKVGKNGSDNGHATNGLNGSKSFLRWKDFSEENRLALLEEAYFQMTRPTPRLSLKRLRALREKSKSESPTKIDWEQVRQSRREMEKLSALDRQRLLAQSLASIYGQALVAGRR